MVVGQGARGREWELTILTECVVYQCGLSDILKELGCLRNVDVWRSCEVAIFEVVCAKALRLKFNTAALVKFFTTGCSYAWPDDILRGFSPLTDIN